jgi:2-dehydropantoate 2-reductase
MKVSFLGAGAIGSMFGGLLKQSQPNIEVVLISRGEHGKTLCRQQAVTIIGPWGTKQIPLRATDSLSAIQNSDFVFVTVKSQDTAALIRDATSHLGQATIVSIQNGINDPELAEVLPSARLVMGMTSTNMATIEPGRVSMQLDGATLFGAPHGAPAHEAARKTADLFSHVQLPGLLFATHDNILGVRYNKLTINALGYASCLSASNFINEALGDRDWRHAVGRRIVEECHRIYRATGTSLAKMPGRSDLGRVERLMGLLDTPLLGTIIRIAVRRRFNRAPIIFSLLQDLHRGKRTEVEFINGQIVKLARSARMQAPVNQTIVQMTQEIEGRLPPPFFTRQAVVDRLRLTIQGMSC